MYKKELVEIAFKAIDSLSFVRPEFTFTKVDGKLEVTSRCPICGATCVGEDQVVIDKLPHLEVCAMTQVKKFYQEVDKELEEMQSDIKSKLHELYN